MEISCGLWCIYTPVDSVAVAAGHGSSVSLKRWRSCALPDSEGVDVILRTTMSEPALVAMQVERLSAAMSEMLIERDWVPQIAGREWSSPLILCWWCFGSWNWLS